MQQLNVFQDGRDFYVGNDDETLFIATAPMRVLDFDMPAAAEARDWFVKIWCPMHQITPQWVGETF